MGAANPALQGRPADHNSGQMLAPNDCSICHTTANWNSTTLPAGHMPNPANQTCTVCHTKAPTDFTTTTLASNAVLHTGISSGCITCHGAPSASAPVFYLNYTPKSALLSPVHIPTSTTPCESCHTATVFTAFSGTTMTSAKHTAMFAVIGKTCDACHNAVTPALSFYGVSNLTTRPSDHNSGSKKTNDCSGCHNPNNWGGGAARKPPAAPTAPATSHTTIATVVNPAAVGPRISVAGLSATAGLRTFAGLSTAATPSTITALTTGDATQRCAATHAPSSNAAPSIAPVGAQSFGAPSLSHAGVTGACASCHNGVLAAGKSPQHIASNAACADCHTTFALDSGTFSASSADRQLLRVSQWHVLRPAGPLHTFKPRRTAPPATAQSPGRRRPSVTSVSLQPARGATTASRLWANPRSTRSPQATAAPATIR